MKRKTTRFELRLDPEERARWEEQAASEQTTVSELIRSRMNETPSAPVRAPEKPEESIPGMRLPEDVVTLEAEIESLLSQNDDLGGEVEKLEAEIAWLKRQLAVVSETQLTKNVRIPVESEAFQSLTRWLSLLDSDGEIDFDLLESYRQVAEEAGIPFRELIARAAVYSNLDLALS